MANTIIWHCLPGESEEDRIDRLNKELLRIFFDGKDVCPERFVLGDDQSSVCMICGMDGGYWGPLEHSTPHFMESLDAMQLIVESGKFAEVREEFFHWLASEGKPAYECTIILYNRSPRDKIYFKQVGNSRQEAFYLAVLASQGCTVIKDENNEHNEIH